MGLCRTSRLSQPHTFGGLCRREYCYLTIVMPVTSGPVYKVCSQHIFTRIVSLGLTDNATWDVMRQDTIGMPLQISVGRLGVITELDFDIIPQQLLTRTLDNLTFSEYQSWITSIQNTYKAALQSGDPGRISAALKPLDRTQVGGSLLPAICHVSDAELPCLNMGSWLIESKWKLSLEATASDLLPKVSFFRS